MIRSLIITVAAVVLPLSGALARSEFVPGPLLASENAAVVVAGDFDGDARRDLAILDEYGGVTLHLQTTAGTFVAEEIAVVPFARSMNGGATLFAAGDFNEDTRDDLVFAADGGWRLLLSDDEGAWTVVLPAANSRVGIATPIVVDIDRDGHLDLVQAEQLETYPGSGHLLSSALHLYFGDGHGGLQRRGVIEAGDVDIKAIVVGHFNADPFVDIATAEGRYLGEPVNVVVRSGYGGSGFSTTARLWHFATSLAAADFDGDGRTDLIAGGQRRVDGTNLELFRQRPGGLLDLRDTVPMTGTLRTMQPFDADGDGDSDLAALVDAVPSETGAGLFAWPQTDGALQMPSFSAAAPDAGPQPDSRALAVGDFDADGDDDVAEVVPGGVRLHASRPLETTGTGLPPLAPTITSVVVDAPGTGRATLTLSPGGDGGSPILGYRVISDPGGPFVQGDTRGGTSAPIVLTDMPLDVPFEIRVQAFNAAGDGALSAPVMVTAPPIRELRFEDVYTVPEGDTGSAVHALPVELSWPAGPGGVSFDVRSSAYEPFPAVPGVDYEPVDVRVTIPAGATEASIPVTIHGNTALDGLRGFVLTPENIAGATIAGSAKVLIMSEETSPWPLLSGVGGEVVEGDDGERMLPFTMVFDQPTIDTVIVQVDVGLVESVPYRSTPGEDHAVLETWNVELPAGTTTHTVEVPVFGDTKEEHDEILLVGFYVLSGSASIEARGLNVGVGMILDDDRTHPPFGARADRVVTWRHEPVQFDIVANDHYDPARLGGPAIANVAPDVGAIHWVDAPLNPEGRWEPIFQSVMSFVGSLRLPTRVCESIAYTYRCAYSELEIVVRPLPEERLTFDVLHPSGFRDIAFDSLPGMPDARFEATSLVQPRRHDVALAVDPAVTTPWDDLAGTDVTVHRLPVPDDALARTWRILADATAADGDVDLYLGVDTDGDGAADVDELRCTAAMVPSGESCELDLVQPGDAALDYWLMLHNRGTAALAASVDVAEVRTDAPGDGTLVATGPGRLRDGEHFNLRLAWNDHGFPAGQRRVGYLRVRNDAADAGALVPVRLTLSADYQPAPMALASGRPQRIALVDGATHPYVFVDVPEGATSLAVDIPDGRHVDVHLVPAFDVTSPRIDEMPSGNQYLAASVGVDADALRIDAPAAGRYYVFLEKTPGPTVPFEVTATIDAAAPVVRPGSYFDPQRGGHGLVLYPAGGEWAGLWYTYFQDGSPTWLYLQAPAPGVDGLWHSGLYRGAWNGTSNRLTRVGEAIVTPTGPDAFRFTWTLDGETGSEPMESLGRGCPALAGAPLDASSHWFDPAHAGTGYSVQLWPNYEMHLAFVYDAQGVPRFMIAENPSFGGGDATLKLEQLTGFCPLCDRHEAPLRRDVGTYARSFSAGRMNVGIDGLYEPHVPGWWSAFDDAQPLGGPGSTQGCAP